MTSEFARCEEGLSVEKRLLLMLLRVSHPEEILKISAPSDLDWNVLIQLMLHHRIYPPVYAAWKDWSDGIIPDHVMQRLNRLYRQNTFRMLALSAEMELLNTSLSKEGIPVLLLKGPHLAADLYGDVSLRTSSDLDVLVPIERLAEIEHLLAERGYVKDDYIESVLNDWKWRHHHVTFVHPEKGVKVEVHWRLNPGPSKEPAFSELWERRRTYPGSGSGTPMHQLGIEDLFLFLVCHGARHGWSRLRWLLDIDRLVRKEVNWELLLSLLKKYQCRSVAGQAVALAAALLHTPVPAGLEPLLRSKRSIKLAEKAVFYLEHMVNLHTDPVPDDIRRYHQRYLFSIMSVHQRILFLSSFLFPYYEDAKTLPLPQQLHFLYFPLRPFLWIWRKTGLAARS